MKKDFLQLIIDEPDGSFSLPIDRDGFIAIQDVVRAYNKRYMDKTGERRGVVFIGHWDYETRTVPVTIRPHERLSRYVVRKSSVRYQLEAMAVGDVLRLDANEIDAANVRVSAYNIGRGMYEVKTSLGEIIVRRIAAEKSTAARKSLRGEIRAMLDNYAGPIEINGNSTSIRLYVSEYNAEKGTKFSVNKTEKGLVIQCRQQADERAAFIGEMASRAIAGGTANKEDIARFKDIARWVVTKLEENELNAMFK